MKIMTENVHVNLGMKITYYFDDGTFGIGVSPHLKQTVEEFAEDIVDENFHFAV